MLHVLPALGEDAHPVAIGVGAMGDRTRTQLGAQLRQAILNELRAARQVTILPEQRSAVLDRSLSRRRVARYYVEGSVAAVQTTRVGGTVRVRCSISLMLMEDQSRDLRMVLSTAATAEQPHAGARSESRLRAQAIEGAVRGALGRLLRTLSEQPARARS